ncbi:MAG: sensor histidine kinase [Rhodospirillaceae bacterium]
MKAGYSLRCRLLAGAAVSISLALTLAGAVLSNMFATHLRERLDHELANHLDQLAANIAFDDNQRPVLERPLSDPRFLRPFSGLYWQVVVGGVVALRSRSLWDTILTLPGDPLDDGDLHRHETSGPNATRVIVLERSVQLPGAESRFRLAAAESRSVLDAARTEFDRTLILSLVALMLALTLATAFQVAIGLRPLARLRLELAEIRNGRRKSFGSLVPGEVQPFVDDLNHLLAHSAEVVERARVQAGNLAHALKTNLAVIGNDLDCLDAVDAGRIRVRLDDMLRHVNHHLGRARAAAASGLPGWRTEVAPTISALTRTLASLHSERAPAIEIDCAQGIVFAGEKEDLEEIIGNVMDNACKWAVRRVRVGAILAEGDVFRLVVEDDGPGLPEGGEAALRARGIRLDETVPGSGLGLGIVRDLCALYGGSIEFSTSDAGGLKVTVSLPGGKRDDG